MSDEVVRKQAKGVCEETSEKNDWTTFSVNVGRTYPLRLQTKLEAIVEQGRAAKKQEAIWTFDESQGQENPNKPGTHYINRRLVKVEVGGELDPALASASAPTGGGTGHVRSDEERASIELQTVVKAATKMYAREFKDDDDFFQFMARLSQFVARKPPPPKPVATPPTENPAPTSDSVPVEEDDSGIPF